MSEKTVVEKPYDCVGNIIAYESGKLDEAGTIRNRRQ